MSFENYLEVKAISRFAVEMEPSTRHEFLVRACEGNIRLLKQVEAQLELWSKDPSDFAKRQTGRAQRFLGRHSLKFAGAILTLIFTAWLLITFWQAQFLNTFLS